MAQPTLYVIDGYAQFFRAYHAIRTPMTSPVTREPTNMTFGFLGMLLRLLRAEGVVGIDGGRADYLALALDVSGDKETFRSTLYPQYKANREPPPSDLLPQVDRALAVLRAIGVPILGAAGYEADDVIATVAHRMPQGVRLRIVSKDKDLKQLLAPPPATVELVDVHTDIVTDQASLYADSGLRPDQVADMLALMGDTVDNVPGVPGVGPKTASELIASYGSLDALLASADQVKGKRGEAIRAARDAGQLTLSRKLVTLDRNVPVAFDIELASTQRFDLAAMLPILKELGFNRYQDDVNRMLGRAIHGTPSQITARSLHPVTAIPADSTGRKAVRAKSTPSAGDAGGLFSSLERERTPDVLSLPPISSGKYACITTARELSSLVEQMHNAPVVSIDTETTGLSPLRADLCGISVSLASGSGYYIPVRSPQAQDHLTQEQAIGLLRPVLESRSVRKCGHNLKFDLLVLRRAGVQLRGILFDSMVASYLIDASRSSHSLDALALDLLGHTNISIKDLIGSGPNQRTFDTVPLDLATEYAAEDADIALQLRNAMDHSLDALSLRTLFDSLEMPLVEVLAELEWNGVSVDPCELDRQRNRLASQIGLVRASIDQAAQNSIGRLFNPDSPKQLASALFAPTSAPEPGLGLKIVKRTPKGEPSTDAESLEKLADDPTVTTPLPGLIVEYRTLSKLVGTYLIALKEAINPETGRIHASFNQTVAVTGRLASSDPNLQNIPIRTDVGREIRRAFVAPPGRTLVSADYSQIELRLLAHLSKDPALIEAFHQGVDIHTAVAAQVNGVRQQDVTRQQRSGAKMVNFGIVYGVTPFGLARRLGVSNAEAERIITDYKRRFAGISTFLAECVAFAQQHGYVETMLKRRRPLPDIHSNVPSRRAFAERTAINSVVQGSAADLIKLAMVDLHGVFAGDSPLFPNVRMILQIHDELVFECDGAQAENVQSLVVQRMQNAMSLSVPLRADSSVAANWFDGK